MIFFRVREEKVAFAREASDASQVQPGGLILDLASAASAALYRVLAILSET